MDGRQTGCALTVGALIEKYMRHADAEGTHTAKARLDRAYIFRLFTAAYGGVPADALKAYHLTEFVAEHPEWKTSGTRRLKAGYVKAVFGWAWREGRIDRHPFLNVQYAESERRPDMPDDVFEQICTLANKRYERVLRMLRYTGCRIGEVCQATADQFDLARGVWVIEKHKGRKKSRKPKVVVLGDLAADVVREAQAAAVASAAAAVHGAELVLPVQAGPAQARVFLNSIGRPWTPANAGQYLIQLKKRFPAVAVPATLHGIRHRYGSTAVANGVPIKHVADQMGHRNVRTTEQYYVDLSQEIETLRRSVNAAMPRKVA